jgi:signal transduction histidine kinase
MSLNRHLDVRSWRRLQARLRRALGGRHLGITQKLWFGFGSILAVICASLIVAGVLLVRVDIAQQWVSEYAEPMSAAAFEMEINTVETGLSVMKFAKSPDPEHVERFKSEQTDFRKWAKAMDDLARHVHHEDLVHKTKTAYEKFVRLGQTVIDAKSREREAAAQFMSALTQFHESMDQVLNLDARPFGDHAKGRRAADALQDVQANLNELTLFLFSYMEMGAPDAWVEVEAHDSALDACISSLREYLAGTVHQTWADELAARLKAVTTSALNTVAKRKATEATIGPFIDQRQLMDDLLDEEVQIVSGRIIAEAKSGAAFELRMAFAAMGLCGVLSLLCAYFIVRRLSEQFVTPVQELAAGAVKLAASEDEPVPLAVRSGDELGKLTAQFNLAASKAWSARSELARANRRLEHDVAARTRELEEALDAAEASSKAKTTFLANMSHELRTPLNAIIGFSDILSRQMFGPLGNEKYPEYSKLIHESGTMLLDLINDLLDLSRIEASKFELHYQSVDIGETIATCVRIVSQRGQEKNIEITQQIDASELTFSADARAIKQIILNLLSNAVKFTNQGGKISVRVYAEANILYLRVRDNGIGIPAHILPRLAKPFEQASNDPSRTHGGSGLGLSLVKSLAQLHGGNLDIQSQEGHGTEVTVTLPLDRPAESGTRAA